MTTRPLAGTLVVDLSRYLPGPLTSQILASLGARVLKVEEPRLGDPVRLSPPRVAKVSSLAALLLSGVESLALDLKKEAGREVLLALLKEADVMLESFRPGTLARLGLDPAQLRRRFPRLVIASVSGFGQDGPAAGRAGHDLTYQALAGSLAPTARMPALPVADVVGAWTAVAAILAALLARSTAGKTREGSAQGTGGGSWIDAALYDAAAHANLFTVASEAEGPQPVGRPHDLAGRLPCYGLYQTRDGAWVALAALEERFWKRFCRALDRKDLLPHQYATTPEAHAAVAKVLAQWDRATWTTFFTEHDLPAEPVLSVAEALRGPQAQARSLYRRGSDGLQRAGFPALFDGRRPRAGEGFPALGEHTREVLAQRGLASWAQGPLATRAGVGRRRSWRRWLAEKILARRRPEEP